MIYLLEKIKTAFSSNIEIKSISSLLSGFIDLRAIPVFISGIIIGHFISPYLSEIYDKTRQRINKIRKSD